MRAFYSVAIAAALGAALSHDDGFKQIRDEKPRVDIDYAVHEASLDLVEGYAVFKNIRYGDPPVGDLRFQPPMWVSTINRTVSDGSVGSICPQAYPEWALEGKARAAGISTFELLQVVLNDPRVGEDCLFLNVYTPAKALEVTESKLPVLVWFHGGGYVFGHKDDEIYNPAGLISQTIADGSDGVIFVSVNYRLGIFGWLNGNGDDKIFPNAGLHDQRLALDWVQHYISRFGGDPGNVTVAGQSAGAGSIIHHITANGGNNTVPFKRALIQSPSWENVDIQGIWTETLSVSTRLSTTKVGDGATLAKLDFRTLIQINGAVTFASSNGSFKFSPTVDFGYVLDRPEALFLAGLYNSTPELMIGHNANEAGLFFSTPVITDNDLMNSLNHVFSAFKPESVQYIVSTLYPPPTNSKAKGLYTNNLERAMLIASESAFVCHVRALSNAFGNSTWNYRFDIPPAVHAQDLSWTFFNGRDTTVNPELARAMQAYFTTFAMTGRPDLPGVLPNWSQYGDEASILTFGMDGIGNTTDDAESARCDFWEKGDYLQKMN